MYTYIVTTMLVDDRGLDCSKYNTLCIRFVLPTMMKMLIRVLDISSIYF